MTEESLNQIGDSFQSFHSSFADCFGRSESRRHCNEYTRGLITQCQERCNAENLSEVVPASARDLQRFLTESRWSDRQLIGRLQEVMAPRLEHPNAVWVVDESGFIKQGKKSVGVARQYCGTAGKICNCQVGVFLAYVTPAARLLVDKELLLPEAWCSDPKRCEASVVPEEERVYRSKPELALRELRRAKAFDHLHARWVAGDDHYGQSPLFRRGLEEEGFQYVLDVPKTTPVWPADVKWQARPWSGRGRPPKEQPLDGQKRTAEERACDLDDADWVELTLAQGSQGPRRSLFARQRGREGTESGPGQETWLIFRKNLDGTEPHYYLSNAGLDETLETLARVAGSRWSIETEFEEAKGQVGLDEYEVRSWWGWHHHMALSLLANAFLLSVQQDAGKKSAAAFAASSLSDRARTPAAQGLDPRRPDPMADRYAVAQ